MKIGICGGTFDPFHRGHLEPVLSARPVMQWDRLIYIPANRQPFKSEQRTESGYHRFAMAVLATETFEEIFVSTQELERGSLSYTVETLELLRSEHEHATLDWIVGDDNLAQLKDWKRIDRIFELANFAVLTRDGAGAQPAKAGAPFADRVTAPDERGTHGNIVFAHNPTVPISSTEIRRRIRAGQPIGGLVDPRVSHYIEHYRLYREAQP
ncbi:MAG TPA: nicotinate-nucleotide adenylyltransferase [Thermoanaerobaculia bacterium]|nr:nicotinate-nucleotide adenylyltransferase [Thermoanaerobaculia bacterium]